MRMIVEWTKGSPLRHAWQGGRLVPLGEDRPAPVNYGLLPGLLNPADGEEVDAVLLGPPHPLGEAEGEVVGLLSLADGDHKVVLAGEGHRGEDLEPLLAWFAPERAPRLLPKEAALAFLEERRRERDRYLGALLGLAVGDALGAQVEFMPQGSFPPVTEMKGGGPHRLGPGEWTDDTAMALCLAESLVEKGFDPLDQMRRYLLWYREGRYSPKGHCFGIGNTTRRALERFLRTGDPFSGPEEEGSAGNGSLMRLAPVALAYARSPRLLAYARLSARTTHGARAALESTEVLAWLLKEALLGRPKAELLALEPFRDQPLHPDVAEVVGGSFWRRAKAEGYAPRTLEAALHAFAHTGSFAEGMRLAVNLGGDADTVGAVYGQLAGAYYGREAIPEAWLGPLYLRERIEELAFALYRMSMASPKE
jgi:ADP-ribosyl-[dinitrogen reductase] hydrolase